MKIRMPWMARPPEDEINQFESMLRDSIRPIDPRPGFVNDLYGYLLTGPLIDDPYARQRNSIVKAISLGVLGVVSGTVLIFAGIKLIRSRLAS